MTSTHTPFRSAPVGGVPFAATDMQSAIDWVLHGAVADRLPVNVRLANAFNVALASRDKSYRDVMVNHGVNLPDGTPIVWFLRLHPRTRSAGRVRGPSFFTSMLAQSAGSRVRHFLLGGSPSTLKQLQRNLRESHPDLIIAGSYSPPFAAVDRAFIEDCAKAVRLAEPDVVWVGLGTPKQDFVGTELARLLEIPTVNVGAAFDFVAGSTREAPQWIQRSGFEWLHRLCSEPRRLWRRYVFGNARFLWVATADLIADGRKR